MTRTAVITGASRGIGRASAIALSKQNDVSNIILIARDVAALNVTASLLDKSVSIMTMAIDLESQSEIEHAMAAVNDVYDGIDILLNIAGYTDPKFVEETSLESFIKTYNINVFSVFALTKACIPYMKHRQHSKAKILNVASTAGITPRPGWISYASSKAAIIAMSQTLSAELEKDNILVYCISPGRTATDLRKTLAPEEDPTTIMQAEEVGDIISNLMATNELCLDGQNIIVRKQLSVIPTIN